MPVTVVVGGQFGSEGKGKVAHEFARRQKASVAVRTGGSNSGHTVIDETGRERKFRHLPTAAILSDVTCVIGPGTYVDVGVLLAEIAETGLPRDRLVIDPSAVIIEARHKEIENATGLRNRIGSTGSGTGAAVAERIMRSGALRFAENDPRLSIARVEPVRRFLRERLTRNERVILEGTQGFGLSLLHSDNYPYVTSRDTSAAAFVSEAGLSPFDVDEIVMVIRAFPIRVSGNSGPLPREIDWQTVTNESGSATAISEQTTVTGTTRRVARFDPNVVRASIEANRPTQVVLNHVDYVDHDCQKFNALTEGAEQFVAEVEAKLEIQIDEVGFGAVSLVPRINRQFSLYSA